MKNANIPLNELQIGRLKTTFMSRWKEFFVIVCIMNYVCLAQDQKDSKKTSDWDISLQEKSALSVVQPPGVALESTVDPVKYFVGPSDVIAINIWVSPPVNFTLTVTPEGTLIIPTVNEVRVADMTLALAKEKILAEVRKKYLSVNITATLVKPRPIVVAVTGNVLNEGLYTLTSVDRVNKAIDEANKLQRIQRQDELATILGGMSTRNIVVKHKDNSQDRVDIAKFFATKEDRWNPYLREGDVVIIPRKNQTKNVFGIYGEVNAPGRYEVVEGDSLLDAVKIAQGFTRLAMKERAEFSRLSADGTQLTTQVVDLPAMIAGQLPNIALEPGDRIVVKPKKELREDYHVTIGGEVLYPGVYPITKDRTRLSDALRQAGGFTEFVSLRTAELYRRNIAPWEAETDRLMSLRGGVSSQDSSDYLLETELRIRKEIVNVDFEQLFTKGDSTQDVILQDGDYIGVPSKKKSIYVFGQIVSPGHIPFLEGAHPDYYIKKAGGFTERARRGDMKIIKGKTKQWLAPDETSIEDGDYIWVPKDPDRPFSYYMTVASQAASVLSVIIGIAVVITQVTK